MLSDISTSVATTVDISGGIAVNAPMVGMCVKANADSASEHALIDLQYLGS